MNRDLWTQRLTEFYCPPLPCPTCGKGVFALVPKSLVYQETAKSRSEHHNEDWWFGDTDYRFTARLKCGNSSCGDEAVILGNGGLEEHNYQNGSIQVQYFTPKFCLPMPDIIAIPPKCPPMVASELRASFTLFWPDSNAAANRIRAAVERMMDHFRIPLRRRNTKRKLYRLSLDERLTLFVKTDKTLSDRLMAIKWFGNTGSHERDLTRDEVLNALDILEDTLVDLFEKRTHRLAALTRTLMKRHAPRKKKNVVKP